jgi:hypothetical protein
VAPANDKLSRTVAAHDARAHGDANPGRKPRLPTFLRRAALPPVVAMGLFPGALLAEAAQGGWPISGGAGMNAAYLAQMLVGLVLVVAAILVLAFFCLQYVDEPTKSHALELLQALLSILLPPLQPNTLPFLLHMQMQKLHCLDAVPVVEVVRSQAGFSQFPQFFFRGQGVPPQ